jgi:uncharacterized membrane protein
MHETAALISSPIGVLAILCAVAGFFFYLERATGAKFFHVDIGGASIIPNKSIIYSGLSTFALPAFIVLMLIKVDVPAVIRIMGKGVLVMLMGTAGVMAGGVISYMIVHRWLSDDAWMGFGALAGSWIGGTANMAATKEMLGTSSELFGLAVIADNAVYIVWLPLLLMSRNFADRFNAWARVPEERLAAMEAAAELHAEEEHPPTMPEYVFLAAIVIGVTWIGIALAPGISQWIGTNFEPLAPVFGESTTRILLVTTVALLLSATPVSRLPNSTAMGTALVYIFVAGIGARAEIGGLAQAPAFLLGAFIWIFIHGAFCLAGAWLFRVDVHSVAIASAANIGAAASAPIVAAHHKPSLVPVSVLMALLGYAMGNYLAPLTGYLAKFAAGQ